MSAANIILSGQQVQPVNALLQGAQAGQQFNDMNRENDMRAMIKQNGAGIMAGDQGALNALAGFDPQAALGVQSAQLGQDQTRLNMDATQQRMDMLSREEQRAVQAHASQMSAQERAAEAARIEQAVAAGLQVQTPEQWDAMMAQSSPDLVGQFDNREAIAGRFMSIAESIKRMDEQNAPEGTDMPAAIQALEYRAAQAGLTKGTPEYQQFMLNNGSQSAGTRMTVSPDGTVNFSQGGTGQGGNGKDLTVDAAKNTGFLIRAQESNAILDELEAEGTSLSAKALNSAPLGLGNYFQSPDYQKYDQARRDLINAILRRESGAVIADSEFANAERQYFPQPGDSPEVIAQKRRNRENAVQGMEVGAADGVNRIDPPRPPATSAPAQAASAEAPDFATMSIEDLEAWLAENGG